MSQYPNLQKRKEGALAFGQHWTLENLKDGFQYFYDLYEHYPRAEEVDSFDYLPSARSIQRTFGGLVQVRKKLNLSGPADYTRGEVRSKIAKEGDRRAKEYEAEFYYFLTSKIPEMRVHEHKIIRPGNVSSDFFIYTSEEKGIVLDLFYAKDLSNVAKIVNIKYKRYISVPFLTYFVVVGNTSIDQQEIDKKIKNRKNKLPSHIKIITEKTFKDNFENLVRIVK